MESSGDEALDAGSMRLPSIPHRMPSSGSNDINRHYYHPTSLTHTKTLVKPRPLPKRCGFPNCVKTAKPGGFCISHGGGKKCCVEGCNTSVVSRGRCVAHGGGKRCQHQGCTKSAQTGGFCWIHGGGKKCGYDGCTKRAQSGGACIAHGGGKRCRIDGCNKVVQYEGLCVGHGGYRKCLSMNCMKKALSSGYCALHGGNTRCRTSSCKRKAVHSDLCADHSLVVTETPIDVRPSLTSADMHLVEEEKLSTISQRVTRLPILVRADPVLPAIRRINREDVPRPRAMSDGVARTNRLVSHTPHVGRCSDHGWEWPPTTRRSDRLVALVANALERRDMHPWPYLDNPSLSQRRLSLIEDESIPRDASWCCVAACPRLAKRHGMCLLHSSSFTTQRDLESRRNSSLGTTRSTATHWST